MCVNCLSSDSCSACTGNSANSCTACKMDSKMYLNSGKCETCIESSTKWYNPLEGGKCEACSVTGCSICAHDGQCIACTNTTDELVEGSLCCDTSNGKYVNKYVSPYSCDACATNCKTCTGPGPNQCTSCNSSYIYNSTNNSCEACPTSTWYNPTSLACESCTPNCSSCPGGTNCTSCLPNFVLDNGVCVPCGPGGGKFKAPDGTCKSC